MDQFLSESRTPSIKKRERILTMFSFPIRILKTNFELECWDEQKLMLMNINSFNDIWWKWHLKSGDDNVFVIFCSSPVCWESELKLRTGAFGYLDQSLIQVFEII